MWLPDNGGSMVYKFCLLEKKASICLFVCFVFFFLSIYTGSLILEHYTRECESGNFDKIKNKNITKKQNNTKKTKTFG